MTECLLILHLTSTNAVVQKDKFPIRKNKKPHPIKETSEPTQTTLFHAINQKWYFDIKCLGRRNLRGNEVMFWKCLELGNSKKSCSYSGIDYVPTDK